jgi:hypothetical protein
MSFSGISELKINHEEEPIRLFKSDFLEFFTHIHPGVVLLLFVPVVLFSLYQGIVGLGAAAGLGIVAVAYGVGFLVWTLTEYVMHRYVFHYEPTQPVLKWVWYLIHGVHSARHAAVSDPRAERRSPSRPHMWLDRARRTSGRAI